MNAHNICSSAIVGEVLTGEENYANWRACMENYLRIRDLWDVVVEENRGKADTKAWRRRNVSALHAIQISCAPRMLSYIRHENIAKDAWDSLAQKCQPEGEDEDEDAQQPVDEFVERTQALGFLRSINRSELRTTRRQLTANPGLSKCIDSDFNPLRFAIRLGNLEMINVLLRSMSAEAVAMQDGSGRTALHYAAMNLGQIKIAERLIEENEELLRIAEKRDHIPLISACYSGHKDMTHYLYYKTTQAYLLLPENQTLAAMVVCSCVESNFLDVALDLLDRRPTLAFVRYKDRDWNAVLALSYQQSSFLSGSELSFWQRKIYSCLKVKEFEPLFSEDDVRINTHEQQEDQNEMANNIIQGNGKPHGLWSNLLKFFGIREIYDLKQTHVHAHQLLLSMSAAIADLNSEEINQNFVLDAIFNASARGMREFIVEIIRNNPDILTFHDNKGRNIFLIAVAHRQEKVFSLIYGHAAMKYDVPNFIDVHDNSMLHLAGKLEPESQIKLNKISGAALQMQRELQWFKEIESIMPPSYKDATNQDGETAYEVFDQSHAKLLKEGEQWIKDIAQSSTIVGSLIITIMFAALFTVPGGNNQETGIPLLLIRKLFKVFMISDAISLFASSTSVLIFVGLLASRYSKDDFLTSLPKKLIVGLFALFISIAAMMVAFCSTVFLMLQGQLEIVIPIVLLAAIPISTFVWFQFPLLVTVSLSTYGPGIFDRKTKEWL